MMVTMKNNNWWEVSIGNLIQILKGNEEEKLQQAFDIKYGDYDYSEDLRTIVKKEFENNFNQLLNSIPNSSKVLVCGANSGYEMEFLGGLNVTALDISYKALRKLRDKFPYVKTIHGNMNKLPFDSNSFNLYINLRSIQSHGVDLDLCISEAHRVLRDNGQIIISIPNGYMNNTNVIKGMWDSTNQKIDENLPLRLAEKVKDKLSGLNYRELEIIEITSEIIIVGHK